MNGCRVIVRAVEERREIVEGLLPQLPGATAWYDQHRDTMRSFKEVLAAVEQDAVLLLEDDIALAAGFWEKATAIIAERPDDVIQFFSLRQRDAELGSRWMAASSYLMGQCTYFPAGMAADMAGFAQTWGREDEHPWGTDVLVKDFLMARKRRYWLVVPSLVQHLVMKSAIDPRRSSRRQSPTFAG